MPDQCVPISVVIPSRDPEPDWLDQAVQSVLDQGAGEILIVDDGTNPVRLGRCYRDWGRRVSVLPNPGPAGVAGALNHGLLHARHDLVARLDADDFALPGRLHAQASRMSTDPWLAVLGTWARQCTGTGKMSMAVLQAPPEHRVGIAMAERQCPFIHPTVMLRRSLLPTLPGSPWRWYPEDAPHAEDVALWSRCILAGLRVDNLPVALTCLRRHRDRVSLLHSKAQAKSAEAVFLAHEQAVRARR